MTAEMVLDEGTAARIDELAEEGNVLLEESGDWHGAVAVWEKALTLLPVPASRWGEAVWLHASIGTAQRDAGDAEAALQSFIAAHDAPDGHLNPYVLLQVGSLLRTRDEEEAVQLLLRAYMLEGDEIFEENPDDLEFLAAHVDLSPRSGPPRKRFWKGRR